MASDVGPRAPNTATLPSGVRGVKAVAIGDPSRPGMPPRYVYVMKSGPNGPKPAYDASNGYVHYQRDPNAR